MRQHSVQSNARQGSGVSAVSRFLAELVTWHGTEDGRTYLDLLLDPEKTSYASIMCLEKEFFSREAFNAWFEEKEADLQFFLDDLEEQKEQARRVAEKRTPW